MGGIKYKLKIVQDFNMPTASIYILKYEDGKTWLAKTIPLEFIEMRGGQEYPGPTARLEDPDFYSLIMDLKNHLTMHGVYGEGGKEMKRLELHLEDMRKLVFKDK